MHDGKGSLLENYIYYHPLDANLSPCLSSLHLSSPSTITLVGAKKRKRNASSDHSDGELSPASPAALEDDMTMVQEHTWSDN